MGANDIDAAVDVVRQSARQVACSDGVAIVRRFGDRSAYVAEDSIAPLWAGRHFPLRECVAGRAMLENRVILAPDIARSDDVPLNLYIATYVRRMAVYPFGIGEPIGALCAYWRDEGPIDDETSALLASLARAMAGTFETLFILDAAAKRQNVTDRDLI
jgi:hypothetical protein